MLVSLKCTMDLQTGAPTDTLDKDALHVGSEIGSSATTMSEASQDPLWIKYINDGMKAGNAKTTSNAQIVQKVCTYIDVKLNLRVCTTSTSNVPYSIHRHTLTNNNNTLSLQQVHWLPKDFSEMEGDLTPTMKLKRGFVTKKYSALIDEIYGESVAN